MSVSRKSAQRQSKTARNKPKTYDFYEYANKLKKSNREPEKEREINRETKRVPRKKSTISVEHNHKRRKRRIVKSTKNTKSAKLVSRNRKRRRKNSSLNIFNIRGVVLFGIALTVVLLIASCNLVFKPAQISIEGKTRYAESEIKKAAQISEKANIFSINSEKTTTKILEALTYIEKVEITYKMPNKVSIKVSEGVPRYQLNAGKNYILVSKKGHILQITDKKSNEVVPIIKISNSTIYEENENFAVSEKEHFDQISELINMLERYAILDKIKSIDFFDFKDLKFDYDSKFDVKLGTIEDLEYKLKMAIKVIENARSSSNKINEGVIDVSSSSKSGKAIVSAKISSTDSITIDNNAY